MERHNLSAPQAYTRLRDEATTSATMMNDTAASITEAITRASPQETDEP